MNYDIAFESDCSDCQAGKHDACTITKLYDYCQCACNESRALEHAQNTARYAQMPNGHVQWDNDADKAFPNWQNGDYLLAEKKLGRRPFAPRRKASPRCQSGGHAYCTCDTCF